MKNLYGVILAGGRGERFWPISRMKRPKQLLPIVNDKPMIEETINRLSFIDNSRIFIVGTKTIEESIKKLDLVDENNLYSEPFGKNTALAIGYTAVKLNKINPDSIMLITPADHDINDSNSFQATIKDSYDYALKNYLITFGITPTRPEVGYGYIELGEALLENKIYKIKSFKEKPNLKTANTYLKKGNILWNSGIFLWKTSEILNEIKLHLPDMYKELMHFQKFIDTNEEEKALNKMYKKCKSISIDFGVMEQSKKIIIVRTHFKWDDVGNWIALERLKKKDKNNNIMLGDIVELNANDNILYAEDGLIATIGVEDLIIVRTKDITFVAKKRDINDIKSLIKKIEKNNELKKYL